MKRVIQYNLQNNDMINNEEKNAFEYLWSMPIGQRNVAYLFYYEGISTGDISNMLNLSTQQVSVYLSEMRSKLTPRGKYY